MSKERLYKPLFRRPFYKDWTLWLGALGIAAGVTSVAGDYTDTNLDDSGFLQAAFLIDVAFAVAFQFFLFALVPALIRRYVTARRVEQVEPSRPSVQAGWAVPPSTPATTADRPERRRVAVGVSIAALIVVGFGVIGAVVGEAEDSGRPNGNACAGVRATAIGYQDAWKTILADARADGYMDDQERYALRAALLTHAHYVADDTTGCISEQEKAEAQSALDSVVP